jgi:hypothetical protein
MESYIKSEEAAEMFCHQLQIFIDLKDIHCSIDHVYQIRQSQ